MDRTEGSLLEQLQRVIERTYDLRTGVEEIGRFVIGDEGYRRLDRRHPLHRLDPRHPLHPLHGRGGGGVAAVGAAGAGAGAGARTLVRETGAGGLALSIYYPDSLIECLERHDPARRLDDANVEAFSILVEELDHFLVIADRHRSGGGTTLLDLELHANVTKYLVLALFVARLGGRSGGRLAPHEAIWIRWHLFEKGEYDDPDPVARARYAEARRLAARWLDRLGRVPAQARPAALRRFHRMPTAEKVARAMAP